MKINRLDEVFSSKGIKNRVLAVILKKSESTISLWRNNKRQPALEELYKISRLLRIDIHELIEKTDWKDDSSMTYEGFLKEKKLAD